MLNILEDFDLEKQQLKNLQIAILNILEDSNEEKKQLQQSQRAFLNILEDIEMEKRKVTDAYQRIEVTNKLLEQYKILFDSIDEGFCIIEMIFDEQDNPVDYRFLQVNASFEKQTGIQNAQGKRMLEIAPKHEKHWFEIYGKIALTGESYRFENKAAQLGRYYDVYAFRFNNPEKRQVAILFNDITERKKTENKIIEKSLALERSNQALDEFAYAASHDLKAPLRVIDNASKWLEEDLEPHLTPETRENMNLLRKRVKRMEKLLDDLLEYSRIGIAQDKHFSEIMAGNYLINSILELLSPPKTFVITVDPYFSKIVVPKMPLQQIFMNLISNAIKHHDKQKGHIIISVKENTDHYTFSVKDDGPGIAPEFHKQIFKMFQTLKPRDQVEGSGMGLAIVKKNIESFGGTLHLESAKGKGSTFSFVWPKNTSTGNKDEKN